MRYFEPLKIYYRISDRSYPKQKLPGTTKFTCLDSFLEAFRARRDEITLIADNCDEATMRRLTGYGLEILTFRRGNAGSLRAAFDHALTHCAAETLIYFVEDDYLHRAGGLEALMEADDAQVGDYLTLYDHPDKYSPEYGGGESSRVVRAGAQHWRYTKSTTMTFACRAWTLLADRGVWDRHIEGAHPDDHGAFSELTQSGRRLAVAIPGLACHIDLTWGLERGQVAIDRWAIEMMAQKTQAPGG